MHTGADADLTKMLSHMQAIEFGEDDIENIPPSRGSTQITGLGVSAAFQVPPLG